MAKSHNQLVLEQAEREIGKSINTRVLLANGGEVSEADVKSQGQRLTSAASSVSQLINEPKAGAAILRLKFELDQLLNTTVEAHTKKRERELVVVA